MDIEHQLLQIELTQNVHPHPVATFRWESCSYQPFYADPCMEIGFHLVLEARYNGCHLDFQLGLPEV
jgi:hypothetical protein